VSDSALVIRERQPDAPWFGSVPELYADKRGPGVGELIVRIDKAAREYPYSTTYTLWPGPNSNTFTAWISRAVPELQVDLPATAVGKDISAALSCRPRRAAAASSSRSPPVRRRRQPGRRLRAESPRDELRRQRLGRQAAMVGRVGMPHFFDTAKR